MEVAQVSSRNALKGHLGGSVVECLPLAQVVIPGSWDLVLHLPLPATLPACAIPLSSLSLSLPLPLSQYTHIINITKLLWNNFSLYNMWCILILSILTYPILFHFPISYFLKMLMDHNGSQLMVTACVTGEVGVGEICFGEHLIQSPNAMPVATPDSHQHEVIFKNVKVSLQIMIQQQ